MTATRRLRRSTEPYSARSRLCGGRLIELPVPSLVTRPRPAVGPPVPLRMREGEPGAFVVPAAVRRDPVSNYKPLWSFVPGYCRIRVRRWPLN
ncbi:hypothetical protein GCM10027161_66770 [Microbispora hainanensis]